MFLLQQDSNTLRSNSKIGIKVSLATFLKPKEKWNKRYKKLTKFLSRKALLRIGNCKLTLSNRNGTSDVNRKKYSGCRNQECNGLKKEKEIQGFSTNQPWNIELIIKSQSS